MIDRLIVSADNTGEYQKILVDKFKSKADKDKERFNYQRKFKWIQTHLQLEHSTVFVTVF